MPCVATNTGFPFSPFKESWEGRMVVCREWDSLSCNKSPRRHEHRYVRACKFTADSKSRLPNRDSHSVRSDWPSAGHVTTSSAAIGRFPAAWPGVTSLRPRVKWKRSDKNRNVDWNVVALLGSCGGWQLTHCKCPFELRTFYGKWWFVCYRN